MKYALSIIGSYIKSHVVTTVVVSTLVAGTTIATPAVINNAQQDNNINIEEKNVDPVVNTIESNTMEGTKEDTKEETKTVESKETKSTIVKEDIKEEVKTIEQPKEEGLVFKGYSVYYNNNLLMSFSSTTGEYNGTLINVSYNTSNISNLPSDVKQELYNNYCKATPGGCYNNLITGQNEPYYFRKYKSFSEGGQNYIDNMKNDIKNYQNGWSFYNKCINYYRNGTIDPSWDPEDPGLCHKDQGYSAEAFERIIASEKSIIAKAEHDIPLYEESVRNFKAINSLLK